MSEYKYPLFSPKLMQVNSFAYASKDFRPSLREEEIVGVVGCAVDEAAENEQMRKSNIFLAQFDMMAKKAANNLYYNKKC